MLKKIFKRRENNMFFDWYSLRHFLSGLIAGMVLIALRGKFYILNDFKFFILISLSLTILWELFEITLRTVKYRFKKVYKFLNKFLPAYLFATESKINIISDIIIGLSGFVIIYFIF